MITYDKIQNDISSETLILQQFVTICDSLLLMLVDFSDSEGHRFESCRAYTLRKHTQFPEFFIAFFQTCADHHMIKRTPVYLESVCIRHRNEK